MIAALIDNAVIVPSLSSTTKDDAIVELVQAAADANRIKAAHRKPLREALFAREANGSTGIGNGIAVPHVKAKQITTMTLVLGCSADGLPYQAVDGRDVQTVFMILAPENAAEDHLQALRWVSTLARNADFRRFIQTATDESAIRELLHEMSPS